MRRRVRSGRWVQLDRGIVALAGSPPSWERGILALCLSKNGVASHLSAACLHGLSPLPGCSTFEVTVARGRSTRSDLGRVHAMGDAQLVDRVWIGPVPATGLARTLLDVGSAVGYSRHARIVDDALDRRLIDHRDLAECPDRHRGLRRRGIVRLTRLLAERGSGQRRHRVDVRTTIRAVLRSAGPRDTPHPVPGQRRRAGRGEMRRGLPGGGTRRRTRWASRSQPVDRSSIGFATRSEAAGARLVHHAGHLAAADLGSRCAGAKAPEASRFPPMTAAGVPGQLRHVSRNVPVSGPFRDGWEPVARGRAGEPLQRPARVELRSSSGARGRGGR